MPGEKNQDAHSSGLGVRTVRALGLTPIVAAVGAVGLLALLAIILREDPEKGRGRGDQARAAAATDGAGRVRSIPKERGSLGRMRELRQDPRQDGWSLELRDLVRAARRARSDDDRGRLPFQAELVASTIGVDARAIRQMPGIGAHFVTTNGTADRLLLGGVPDPGSGPRSFTAKGMINAALPAIQFSAGGVGPVAFRDNETPVQLIAQPGEQGRPDELSLVDLRRGEVITRFEIPGRLAIRIYQELGLAADASAVAAPVREPGGPERLVVWRTGTPRPHLVLAPEHQGRCLAFTGDGSLVAAGNLKGSVQVWSTATGRELASWTPGAREPIRCLAFGPAGYLFRGAEGQPAAARASNAPQVRVWPLAASDGPGSIRIRGIRELARAAADATPVQQVQDREPLCQATPHEIAALAFSADGTLLVSVGEDQALLWDPTSGHLLLSLQSGTNLRAAAFSPLERSLAICSADEGDPGATSIWSIREGGAIRLLRGSTARFAAVATSPAEGVPQVAAWARSGEVAVWSRWPGMLQHRLATPTLMDPELPALGFSPDGRLLAYAGGGEVFLWDLPRDGEPRSWRLTGKRQLAGDPVAISFCTLRFPAADRLIVTHVDSEQVLRVENLLAPEPRRPLVEIGALGGNVTGLAATPDGSVALVAVALAAHPGSYVVKAFNATTGKLIWSMPLGQSARMGRPLQLTPDGKLVAVLVPGDAPAMLLDVATGEARSMLLPAPLALGRDAKSWISWSPRTADDPGGVRFHEAGRALPIFSMPAELVSGVPAEAAYSADGLFATWVTADNTVAVCDLAVLRSRLAEDGLEW